MPGAKEDLLGENQMVIENPAMKGYLVVTCTSNKTVCPKPNSYCVNPISLTTCRHADIQYFEDYLLPETPITDAPPLNLSSS